MQPESGLLSRLADPGALVARNRELCEENERLRCKLRATQAILSNLAGSALLMLRREGR